MTYLRSKIFYGSLINSVYWFHILFRLPISIFVFMVSSKHFEVVYIKLKLETKTFCCFIKSFYFYLNRSYLKIKLSLRKKKLKN